RKAAAEDLKSQIVPGAEIMTNFGLFGKLLSVNEVTNEAEVETSPGNVVRVHRQTIAKVVTHTDAVVGDSDSPRSVEEAIARADREEAERALSLDKNNATSAPEYGERIEPGDQGTSSKKVDE
ncbi:MAG: preprotein translocase subunit YajC, partial [Glaciihabitans sp.]|nr:preprotein translocase subunit YajC [Glaciihabitans sp.]